MADKGDDLLYEVRNGTAWLTLNREERRNAITVEMIDGFGEYLDRAEQDDDVRAICITGSGDKVFCSGADLGSAMGGHGADGPLKYARLLQRMRDYPKPLVARLNGLCMAGGMGLMLSCDMVYAPLDVTLGTPEVKVGLFPMMISALILENMPKKKAMEMVFTGFRISASEARELGLVTAAVSREDLDATVERTLSAIRDNAPVAISIGRRAMAEINDISFEDSIEFLHQRLLDVLGTEDAAEGIAAFFGKRRPIWKGK